MSKKENENSEKPTFEDYATNIARPLIPLVFIFFAFFIFYDEIVAWTGSKDAANGLILLLVAYFLPYIFAVMRGHLSSGAILLTVILLGWTGIGWIVALIWSFTGNTRSNLKVEKK